MVVKKCLRDVQCLSALRSTAVKVMMNTMMERIVPFAMEMNLTELLRVAGIASKSVDA